MLMPRHRKAQKFKRPLSQNQEHFRSENFQENQFSAPLIHHESKIFVGYQIVLFLSILLLLLSLSLLLLLLLILVEILSLLAELYSERLREILVVTSAPQDNQCEMTFFTVSGDHNLGLMIDLATRTRKNNNQAESLFRLSFNVQADMDNREKARARDKNKGHEFRQKHMKILQRW